MITKTEPVDFFNRMIYINKDQNMTSCVPSKSSLYKKNICNIHIRGHQYHKLYIVSRFQLVRIIIKSRNCSHDYTIYICM